MLKQRVSDIFGKVEEVKLNLTKRLEKIWEAPDLYSFFKKYSRQKPHLVKKGTVLFNSGDPLSGIYFIKSGFIKLYRISDDGRETVIYLTGPGNLLGLKALISKDARAHHYTEALTDCQIINMTRQELFEILSAHPEHLVDLGYAFIERLNHAERRVEGFISSDTKMRIANFLLDITLRFGQKTGKNVLLPLPLTHQRIAEFVGAYRETVTLAVNELERDGVVKNQRGKITVTSLRKLKILAA